MMPRLWWSHFFLWTGQRLFHLQKRRPSSKGLSWEIQWRISEFQNLFEVWGFWTWYVLLPQWLSPWWPQGLYVFFNVVLHSIGSHYCCIYALLMILASCSGWVYVLCFQFFYSLFDFGRGYSVTFARALAIFAVLTILTMVQVKFPVTDVVHWAILVWLVSLIWLLWHSNYYIVYYCNCSYILQTKCCLGNAVDDDRVIECVLTFVCSYAAYIDEMASARLLPALNEFSLWMS